MDKEDLLSLGILAGGLYLISRASSPPKKERMTGKECDPEKPAPYGYRCAMDVGGKSWSFTDDPEDFLGYGHYNNEEGLNRVVSSLGFSSLKEFQSYASDNLGIPLNEDGILDSETMKALSDAEDALRRGEWVISQ